MRWGIATCVGLSFVLASTIIFQREVLATRQSGSSGVEPASAVDPKVVPNPTILFDVIPSTNARERARLLGAQVFYVCYQSADPDAGKTGRIDSAKVVEAIRKETDGTVPVWGMLDFEDPFIAVLMKGPSSPDYRSTIQTMVAAVQAVKIAFPQTRWTYYGVPGVDLWFDGQGWDRLGDDEKRKKLEAAVTSFDPLVSQLDWVSPTVYGKYDPAMQTPVNAEPMLRAERAWRVAQVGVARLCANGKPVIPTIDPFWTPGGKAPFATLIPRRLFIEEQVALTFEAGASGVAIWTAIDYFIKISVEGATRRGAEEPNFGPAEWRAAFTKDFFDGQPNIDWSSPSTRVRLNTRTSDAIALALSDIFQWTTSRTLPPQPK